MYYLHPFFFQTDSCRQESLLVAAVGEIEQLIHDPIDIQGYLNYMHESWIQFFSRTVWIIMHRNLYVSWKLILALCTPWSYSIPISAHDGKLGGPTWAMVSDSDGWARRAMMFGQPGQILPRSGRMDHLVLFMWGLVFHAWPMIIKQHKWCMHAMDWSTCRFLQIKT